MPKLIEKNKQLFILGREVLLSLAEIKAFFLLNNLDFEIIYQKENKLIISADKTPASNEMMNQLGGTIKICEPLGPLKNQKDDIADYLNKVIPSGKIEFSINGFDALGIEIKKSLKQLGRSARYIAAKNTATIIYNNLVKKGADIEICDNFAFITKAVQPIEQFSQRDFGRPGRDDQSGMLPPKLAMIMINLATQKKNSVLFDPFCGSGTVITEAILMGYNNIIGSDISEIAIKDSIKNVDWIKNNYNLDTTNLNIKLFQYDAGIISEKIAENSVDAIIAEPYLGKPMWGTESKTSVEKQAEELKILYLRAFLEFKKIIKKNGVAVFIIPRFMVNNEWIKIDCETEISKLGFKNDCILPEQKHLLYWRPSQHVGREIWRFKKV